MCFFYFRQDLLFSIVPSFVGAGCAYFSLKRYHDDIFTMCFTFLFVWLFSLFFLFFFYKNYIYVWSCVWRRFLFFIRISEMSIEVLERTKMPSRSFMVKKYSHCPLKKRPVAIFKDVEEDKGNFYPFFSFFSPWKSEHS